MGISEADGRRHIGDGIERRRALVSACRKIVCRMLLLGYGVVAHGEIGKVGVDVDRGGGLRRLGGSKYVKGREI